MLESDFLFVISIPIYCIFLSVYLKKKIAWKTILIHSLFYYYLIGLIGVTFFPIPIQKSVIEDGVRFQFAHNNFIPFKSIIALSHKDFSIILKQIGGNILLLLPLGIFTPLLLKKERFTLAFSIGFSFIIAIELLQFTISLFFGYTYRIADVDDVILNSLGFLIGFGLWKFFTLVGVRWNIEKAQQVQYGVGAAIFTGLALVQKEPLFVLPAFFTLLAFLILRIKGALAIKNIMPGIIEKYEKTLRDLKNINHKNS